MKNKLYQLDNLRSINVKFLSPTNSSGARIKIFENIRYSDETKPKSKTLSYCYQTGDVGEQAFQYLLTRGFNPVCRTYEYGKITILCNNWGEDFKYINE